MKLTTLRLEPIPTYVINFNRLEYVKQLIDSLQCIPHCRPIIVDNASTYPPLLEWYGSGCPVEVVRLKQNQGPRVLWGSSVDLTAGTYFAVTDPDLDVTAVPVDVMTVLTDGLKDFPDICKCGLSLETGDLPMTPLADSVRKWEAQFWADRRNDRFFDAMIDTTFAVYRAANPCCVYGPALRSDRPYTARHLPWYITPDTVTDEDRYYWGSLHLQSVGCWSTQLKQLYHQGV